MISSRKTDLIHIDQENNFTSKCSSNLKVLSIDKINSLKKKDKKVSRFPLTDIKPNEIISSRSPKNLQTIHFPYKCYFVPKQQYIKRSKLKKPEVLTIE